MTKEPTSGTNAKGDVSKDQAKRKKGRSPSYPGISLETAIQRAEKVYEIEGKHPAHVDTLLRHWDYAPNSGPGLTTISALGKFGLIENEGTGSSRKARLSPLALRIVQDKRENSVERDAAIREAALMPPIHRELWEKFGGRLPSVENLRFELVHDRHFTETGAGEFIQSFQSTIEFAKLAEGASVPDEGSAKGPGLQLARSGNTKERKQMQGMREDVFNLEEGQVVLQWPVNLSPESFEDFKGWIDLVLSRAKRAVKTGGADPGSDTE